MGNKKKEDRVPVVVKTPTGPGRPTLFSQEIADLAASYIRSGAAPLRALAKCGVSKDTAEAWRAKARQGREPYATLWSIVELAESTALAESEERIRAAAAGGEWKADAWLLERRLRGEYGNKLDVTARPAEIDPETLSDDDLARIAASGRVPSDPGQGDQ